MPWVKLDDRLHAHPKAAKAGLEALGLHMLAMSHCGAYGQTGHVAPEFVQEKAGSRGTRLASRLVESGLWERNSNGWQIHDWAEHNPSPEEVEAKRAQRSAAGKAAAHARWGKA
jgi:hypothetical protein